MNSAIEKIARIIRADKDTVDKLCKQMEEVTGKRHVPEKIIDENETLVARSLASLNVRKDAFHFEVYRALISRIENDDTQLFTLFDRPICMDNNGCKTLLDSAKELANVGKGFFLKTEKAHEFLKNQPPQNIIKTLGYKDVDELLEKEDLFEVFAALRFGEEKQWLNEVFFAQYKDLTPDDFEYRDIVVQVLDKKWLKVAEKFLKKKYHNVSHLKELGIIFIIPLVMKVYGETMRVFGLVLHYLHEVQFYSKLFERYAKDSASFAEKSISALRGDVVDERMQGDTPNWMIVQRYLAKEDEYDWRLFEPHVNPEALHWTKAEECIARLDEKHPKLTMGFWHDLDFIGDFYKTESGVDNLVSFNLIDTVMSLVMHKEMIKYLYHHQEALWNKIFMEYVGGRDKMEKLIIENFTKGYIEIQSKS